MSWPEAIITKTVTAGPAVLLEDGTPAVTQVTVTASRSLTYLGQPIVSLSRTFKMEPGQEVAFPLPVCDMAGMKDAAGRPIEISAGEVTHTYNVALKFYAPNSATPIETRPRGPFALLSSDPAIVDLDDLITDTNPAEKEPVWIVDKWSAQIAAAAQAALDSYTQAHNSANNATTAAANAAAAATSASQAVARADVAIGQAADAKISAAASAASAQTAATYSAQAAADAAFARAVADKDWTGPVGRPGPQGPATIRIGTVETLPAGSEVKITNSGTLQNPVWNIGIPRGDIGSLEGIKTWEDFDNLFI
jgi:hypothetical protein